MEEKNKMEKKLNVEKITQWELIFPVIEGDSVIQHHNKKKKKIKREKNIFFFLLLQLELDLNNTKPYILKWKRSFRIK